jgi:hypothetical protein
VSTSNDHILIVPGESGWEIWTRQADGSFVLVRATEVIRAGDVLDIPVGDLTMLFAVKSFTAVPLRVMSEDEALFPDLVTLHAERLGLKTDPMAGQLSDIFVVSKQHEQSTVLAAFLRTPAEGELPKRGPKAFDLSARSFPVSDSALTLWRELGRWVFAMHDHGKLLYCQATACDSSRPDDGLAREIQLSLMQLEMQGLNADPSRIIVWAPDGTCDVSVLRAHFHTPIELLPRPAPVLCDPLSKLLPADVRAARRAAQQRQTVRVAIAAVVVAYLGLVGWLGGGLWIRSAETQKLIRLAEEAAPEGKAYATHMAKWRELADAIDLNNSSVDILDRIASCIPQNGSLRLKSADVSAASVSLKGEAPQLPAVKTFSLNLTKHNGLSRFKWEMPEPTQTKNGNWEFRYSGGLPTTDSQP